MQWIKHTASGIAALMTLVGAIGIPADLRSWGSVFASLGSEGGRWILVGAGVAVLLLVQLGPRAWGGREPDETDDQDDANANPSAPATGTDSERAPKGYVTFGREVNDATIRSWEANIKHLLRDDTSRLSLFTYDPLAPAGRFTVELVDGLTGRHRVKRLERRLGQLDKVIESY